MDASDISVVVPVRDNGADFRRCLAALQACVPAAGELIVVDDGGQDGSAEFAAAAGARVLRSPLSGGPAAARNRGAAVAAGEALLFVDADVVVPPDTLAKVAAALTGEPEVAAVFGSYDDAPAAPGWLSQYRNLLHHYVHQHADREASTFWAGCGAVRRPAFAAIGGFDQRRYRRPCIEDVELGMRLRSAGYRLCLDHDLQVKHLKRWTAWNTLRTDWRDRAIPWSWLARERGLPKDLNFRWRDRFGAVLAAALPVLLVTGAWRPWAWLGAAGAMAGLVAINHGFYHFLWRKLRWATLLCVPWHWLYLADGAVIFATVKLLPARFGKRPPPP